MPGSRHWFTYTADDETEYSVNLDKSNALAAGFEAISAPGPKLPKGLRMRYVNLIHPASGARRRLQIPEPDADLWTGVANTVSLFNYASATPTTVTFEVTSRIGERNLRLPNPTDTGLTT